MRIIIFLLVVGGLLWWVVTGLSSDSGGGPVDGVMAKLSSVIGNGLGKTIAPKSAVRPSDAPSKPPAGPAPLLGVSATPEGMTEPDKASRSYRFLHRDPPSIADLGAVGGLGCTVVVDSVSRSVVCFGGVKAVELLMTYLESIDTVPGSCAVQSWAVYVDKKAAKGFDLVQAIRATVPSETNVVLGGGGLTIDLGGDELATALNVICDGSVVEVVQRPHVQLMHGVPARIESLQEVPVPSTAVSQGIAQTSVEYRKVGLQLEIIPTFLSSNQLTLAVKQSNGLIGQNVKIGENEVPVIESQSVSTSVRMTVGQTVILGGVSTLRERTVRGLLRNQTEVTEGSLYVILSTYYDVPRAVPVGAAPPQAVGSPVPLGPPMEDPCDWIDAQLLPDLGEVEPVRRSARKVTK